ncbi:aminoglycoside phosphotransferase family protein [Paenibacillus sp. 1001270B_150601_E10]|uniref:aminoglycoside phosphotransferase family protein n=1 Tax=Paenibacillus sp. 1001270B_150601_E10 TaxID=2787079 RepID=UPI00189CD095|nr:aminoglycoside phosphotransferase family protein [Paenibacillus sp. 1001270B_150601_E10]
MLDKRGRKIAEGGCAEIFEWEEGSKILKLARPNIYYGDAAVEYQKNLTVWESGIPSARPFELVDIEGRPGIVFERIIGDTLTERFIRQGLQQADIHGDGELVRVTAQLLYDIHQRNDVPLPPSQREQLIYAIQHAVQLSEAEREHIVNSLRPLPQKAQLCHGDPNPHNILIQKDNKPLLIDWMNAAIGNPEADLAEYIIMIRYAVLPADMPEPILKMFDQVRELMIERFMEEYTRKSGITHAEVEPWLVPIAARKLTVDSIPDAEKERLLHFIRENLSMHDLGEIQTEEVNP